MTISMYQASVPVFVHMLTSLSGVLDKAEAHCTAKKIGPTVLPGTRLCPDMFALSRQVQIACDFAKGTAARLAGVDVPSFADTETTFPELRERIEKTIAFLATFTASQIDGSEDREISMKVGAQEMHFKGLPYLTGFSLPNFYFHVTMVYAIARASGVELGKMDYLGMQRPAA
ncbi:MAG: DUF1993 domain-containing protein [Hyphomicrobiaceae bacterium]